MKDELKNALLCEKIKKGSKVAFVFLHIANVLFNLGVLPRVFEKPGSAYRVGLGMDDKYDYFNFNYSDSDWIMGLAIGAVLIILNFFIIRFLKNYTTWYIEKNITE